ncbi:MULTISPECIES: cupin domain-containing protein [unclassified Streptomyces]|uniref:cupin domain-containing protein n=1 Tax=unclassified Streptomyces TaxID=2593676 RepID=UPI000DAEC82B|nr:MULTISPECIES: cupin domain-containing protein [unclassified Streptomyces]PZT74790.1 cupin [Streptomyces sp. AC1-42T]PZT82224.1 cupin [Streptomyces sp. AC1-42W]
MTAPDSAVVARLGEDFLAEAFGRGYRLSRGDAASVADVINWTDLNEVLARHRMDPPRLRLSADGLAVPPDAYTVPEVAKRRTVFHRTHPAALHEQLANGATLVIDAVDELFPDVQSLASELETALRSKIQVNLYASWTAREGFGVHWDDHDVVVVQIDGSKRWKLYGPTRTAPMRLDMAEPEQPPEEPLVEFVLTPGDVLYLPRGWWHAVSASEGERSLHLTCDLSVATGADLIVWLSEILREHEIVRADLPRFGTDKERAETALALREHLVTALSDPEVIEQYFTLRDANERVRFRPSLPYVTGLPADPELSAQLLTTRHELRLAEEGTTVLTAGGETLTFARAAHPILRTLTDRQPHRLGVLATAVGLTVEQVTGVTWELVKAQIVAVDGAR